MKHGFSIDARTRLNARLQRLKPIKRYSAPAKGWIRAIRDATGMSGVQLAKRNGISPPGVVALERSEANGTIKLNTLRRVADSMDCVLVYAFVPKTSLTDIID